MKTLGLFLDAYFRLVAHDRFMTKHDLWSLYAAIRSYPTSANDPVGHSANTISQALEIACAFYWKPVLCLQRSAVLVKMLRARGFPAHMVIGAQKLPFRAHAWVELNGSIVNDRMAEREKFLVMEVC